MFAFCSHSPNFFANQTCPERRDRTPACFHAPLIEVPSGQQSDSLRLLSNNYVTQICQAQSKSAFLKFKKATVLHNWLAVLWRRVCKPLCQILRMDTLGIEARPCRAQSGCNNTMQRKPGGCDLRFTCGITCSRHWAATCDCAIAACFFVIELWHASISWGGETGVEPINPAGHCAGRLPSIRIICT